MLNPKNKNQNFLREYSASKKTKICSRLSELSNNENWKVHIFFKNIQFNSSYIEYLYVYQLSKIIEIYSEDKIFINKFYDEFSSISLDYLTKNKTNFNHYLNYVLKPDFSNFSKNNNFILLNKQIFIEIFYIFSKGRG
jgi:hypothetical protein